jgi:integrase
MGRKRRQRYSNGDITLGRRGREAVAEFKDHEGSRQRVRLGVPFTDVAAAKAALDDLAEKRRAVQKQAASYRVADLWRLWLKDRRADGFSNAVYDANWVSLEPVFGHRDPTLLETQDFRNYARDRFKLGRKPWTVHTELVRLRACLSWAADTRLVPFKVKVWVPTPGKGRDLVLTFEEARALVNAATLGDPHISLFVVLAFATGARHMAILDLTWDRIDFEAGTIQFDEDLPPDPMSKAWRKGRATVPMNRAVREALELAHRGRQTNFVIEHGAKRLKSVREGFFNAVVRAGLAKRVPIEGKTGEFEYATDITPHTIRHTVATWLDEAEIADKRAAQLLGHRNEGTTKRVYQHTSHSVLGQAVEALNLAFAPLPKIGHELVPDPVENPSEEGNSVPVGQGEQPSGISG